MVGGDLHWIWTGYEIYQEVDYVYGVKALQEGDGFPNAQSALNIVELAINALYLYSTYVLDSPVAPLFGFTTQLMTLSKTVLYIAQEYFCGFCNIGHNTTKDLILYYVCTNGFWILFPTLITIRLGRDIATALRAAQKGANKKKSQ